MTGSWKMGSSALDRTARPHRAGMGMRTLEGRTLGRRYQLHERIGVGDGATVYRATDLRREKDCAVKVMAPDALSGPAAQLQREARIHRTLFHPGIAAYHDSGSEADGTSFIAMELLRGPSLQQELERRGRLPFTEARRIITQLGLALSYLHQRGILHGNVTAHNVLFADGSRDSEVRLCGFGLALPVGERASGAQGRNLLAGTPAYLPPEAMHMPLERLDVRCDQWSLNVLLVQLLSGQLPFSHPSRVTLCHLICTLEPRRLADTVPGLPSHVYAAVQRAFAKSRHERFADIADYIRSLHDLPLLEERDSDGADPDSLGGADPLGLLPGVQLYTARPLPRWDDITSSDELWPLDAEPLPPPPCHHAAPDDALSGGDTERHPCGPGWQPPSAQTHAIESSADTPPASPPAAASPIPSLPAVPSAGVSHPSEERRVPFWQARVVPLLARMPLFIGLVVTLLLIGVALRYVGSAL